jgi:hypothetical protein
MYHSITCKTGNEYERKQMNFAVLLSLSVSLSLSGLLVRVTAYRSRGPGVDSRRCLIFWVVGLERGPLSLVRITEELFQGNNASGLGRGDPLLWPRDTPHPQNLALFAHKQRTLGRYSSLADYRPRSLFVYTNDKTSCLNSQRVIIILNSK